MAVLTNSGLESLLLDLDSKAGQFIRLDSKTLVKGTVKSRTTLEPFASVFGTAKVWKINSRQVQIGLDYQKVVNTRREREGKEADFKSEGTYGEMETKCLLRREDGSFQMRVYHVKHPDDKVRFVRDDGTELSPVLVERLKSEFMPPKKESPKQDLENEVQPLNFKPESILALRISGMEYVMAHV